MAGAAAAGRLAVLVVVTLATAAPPNTQRPASARLPQEDDVCMTCVCRANGRSGACVTNDKCTYANAYGPFCISQPYWVDAGSPVLPGDEKNLPGAFQRCVEEPFCAVQTVRGYMETGPALQDCDHDGIITCRDLMLTHIYGRYQCVDKKDARVDLLMRCLNATKTSAPTTTTAPSRPPTTRPLPTPSPNHPPRPVRPVRPGAASYSSQPHSSFPDVLHFPGQPTPGTWNERDARPMEQPGYGPRFTFNSLHVESQPGDDGETDSEDWHDPNNPFTREMMNAMNKMNANIRPHPRPHEPELS